MNTAGRSPTGVQAYNQVSVQTGVNDASPHRLIQMLIDAALDKVIAARGLMANHQIAAKGKQIGLAVAIIDSLRASLDKTQGGEIAQNLENLYNYMVGRLTDANITNDVTILDEVAGLLKPIQEAWSAIPEDVREQHKQKVAREDAAEQSKKAVSG